MADVPVRLASGDGDAPAKFHLGDVFKMVMAEDVRKILIVEGM